MDIVESLITRLLEMRNIKPGKYARLFENEIRDLCNEAQQILLTESMILKIEAPIKICGDIHGQYSDLLRIFDKGGYPPESKYLFLGDYVDRGHNSIEVICLLLAYKIKFPNCIYILRGNHECASLNRLYGFFEECKRRYNIKLWKNFVSVFNCMPVCAIVEGKIFCVHGGLSPELNTLEQIVQIKRPTDIPEKGLLCDLLWSDPDPDVTGWGNNDRGISYTFGADIVEHFLEKFNFDLVCRAHQVVENGYEFFAKRKLVTLFSAPDYSNLENNAAMMVVSKDLICTFAIMESVLRRRTLAAKIGFNTKKL